MIKKLMFLLMFICAVPLCPFSGGCTGGTMSGNLADIPEENEQACFDAVVLEVNGSSVLVECTSGSDGAVRAGNEVVFSLSAVKAQETVPELSAGDNIRIFYDGMVMETYPLQLGSVYSVQLQE